ncbi:MAG: polysaccharide biosynthesis/export family protein [Terracidiphilus sp.]
MHSRLKWPFALLAAFCPLTLLAQVPLTPTLTESVPQAAAPVSVHGLPEVTVETSVTATRALLGPGDLIDVSVLGIQELTQRLRVDQDGLIHPSLIGNVQVSGKTPDWLRQTIADKLVQGRMVKNPQVQVFVAEYAGQMAFITGEVNHPGAYSLLRSHRLNDLIAIAGGLTNRAGNSVSIVRSGDQKNPVHIDLGDKDPERGNPEIEAGDSIAVDLTGVVYVLGEVTRPGGFLLDRRGSLSFLQAIALAEGTNQNASLKKAVLLHSAEPNAQPILVNLKMIVKGQAPDFRLQAGDIVWVADSQLRNLGRLAITTMMATASGVAIYSTYPH